MPTIIADGGGAERVVTEELAVLAFGHVDLSQMVAHALAGVALQLIVQSGMAASETAAVVASRFEQDDPHSSPASS